MNFDDVMTKLFSFTRVTYYNWLKEERIIIKFINNYFDKEDLCEIIERNGRLEKLELIRNLSTNQLKEKLNFKETEIIINSLMGKLKLISKNNRGSLLYLYVILQKNNEIKNYDELIKFLSQKIEPKKFIHSVVESIKELNFVEIDGSKTDNFTRKGFAKKLHADIQEFFTKEDIDFIFNYKFYFLNEIIKVIKVK
jgi:hypothetical protein